MQCRPSQPLLHEAQVNLALVVVDVSDGSPVAQFIRSQIVDEHNNNVRVFGSRGTL